MAKTDWLKIKNAKRPAGRGTGTDGRAITGGGDSKAGAVIKTADGRVVRRQPAGPAQAYRLGRASDPLAVAAGQL